ncbi:MAG: ATP-dependent DNA helicase RecG [Sedimentisphaeraceae bacterium JB056]
MVQQQQNTEDKLQYLKGVGPEKAKVLRSMGITTPQDLLEYFPRRWEFLPDCSAISAVEAGQEATVVGIIESIDFRNMRGRSLFEVYLADHSGSIRVLWFNGGYLKRQLNIGMTIAVTGKINEYKYQLQITNPKFKIVGAGGELDVNRLGGPVYPANSDISSNQIKFILRNNLDALCDGLCELFDNEFQKKAILLDRKAAFRLIHDPQDEQDIKKATRTLKYEELFIMQLGLAIRRYLSRTGQKARAMKFSAALDSRIRKRFPFMLTADQDEVVAEIIADMRSEQPMNRLLQGDVGSGKTAVAVYAALVAIANKTQVTIMAPTEILAEQHYINICRYLKGSKVKIAMLTGSMPAKKRKELLISVEQGYVDIVVGTVALIEHDVKFKELGLVVIDEQHKFGVDQRAKLRKETTPHCLVMTATPIPRTLAMTVFGDLEVSIIKNKPAGRGTITTKWIKPDDRQKAFEFIRSLLKAGKQAYFVYPRIESTEAENSLKAAIDEFHLLNEVIYPEFEVALLHGRMKADEKQDVMERFRHGKIQILVSTVVIEVGVDVPNATVMVIEDANNFGLAQLHQLRGRIGRGSSNSYCMLFSDSDNEIAALRLDVMCKSNDGFFIAEQDLAIRGPGEMFSTRQHGLPDMKIANIVEDFDLLNMARRDAFKLVKEDPLLQKPKHYNLRQTVISKLGGKLGLTDIA